MFREENVHQDIAAGAGRGGLNRTGDPASATIVMVVSAPVTRTTFASKSIHRCPKKGFGGSFSLTVMASPTDGGAHLLRPHRMSIPPRLIFSTDFQARGSRWPGRSTKHCNRKLTRERWRLSSSLPLTVAATRSLIESILGPSACNLCSIDELMQSWALPRFSKPGEPSQREGLSLRVTLCPLKNVREARVESR